MGRYLLKRVSWAVAQFVVATILLFLIFYVAPGASLSVSAAYETANRGDSVGRFQETGSAVSEYLRFLQHLVHGEFGRSWRNHQDVGFLVSRAWPATASVVSGGLLLWLGVSLAVGTLSALHPRSLIDRLGTVFAVVGASVHPLVLGLVLAWLFGFKLRWLPLSGYCDAFDPALGSRCGGPVLWAYHLLLPWLVVGAAFGALYTRMIRAALLEAAQADFVRTARAKGASEWHVVCKHTLRASMSPLVTILAMDVGVAFGATMFVERVFHVPGLGQLVVTSVGRRDLPVMMGVMVVVTVFCLLLSLFFDVIAVLVDPRITVLQTRAERRAVLALRPRRATVEPVSQPR